MYLNVINGGTGNNELYGSTTDNNRVENFGIKNNVNKFVFDTTEAGVDTIHTYLNADYISFSSDWFEDGCYSTYRCQNDYIIQHEEGRTIIIKDYYSSDKTIGTNINGGMLPEAAQTISSIDSILQSVAAWTGGGADAVSLLSNENNEVESIYTLTNTENIVS